MMEYLELAALLRRREAVDAVTLARVEPIVAAVRADGDAALRRFGVEFGDLPDDDPAAPLWLDRDLLAQAWRRLSEAQRQVLSRAGARIEAFARGQRQCLADYSTELGGLALGHRFVPVVRAGCYAPGGRYPLPSSVLMTALTARAAGVEQVVVASPRPGDLTLGAAYLAGATAVLAVGGAQAIAALAYGDGKVAGCDVVVGPGNRFVTAAKFLVSRHVGIDMLAGPSELVVVADAKARPDWIAADLLAQAEHDEDARPVLLALDPSIAAGTLAQIRMQLEVLPTRQTAVLALAKGGIVLCDPDQAVAACDAIAPEHLALHLQDADAFCARVRHFGAVFVGGQAAQALGDYGVGPNHVLPTGGAARHTGGLSVLDFLRLRTYLAGQADTATSPGILRDVQALAEMEGLVGHARSVEFRARADQRMNQ